jgi:hypothetical protein
MTFHERTFTVPTAESVVRLAVYSGAYYSRVPGAKNKFITPIVNSLRWKERSANEMEGGLSYFKVPGLSLFRLFVRLSPVPDGTQVTIVAGHGPWSRFYINLSMAIGFCTFIVGALLPYIRVKLESRNLRILVDQLTDALEGTLRESP